MGFVADLLQQRDLARHPEHDPDHDRGGADHCGQRAHRDAKTIEVHARPVEVSEAEVEGGHRPDEQREVQLLLVPQARIPLAGGEAGSESHAEEDKDLPSRCEGAGDQEDVVHHTAVVPRAVEDKPHEALTDRDQTDHQEVDLELDDVLVLRRKQAAPHGGDGDVDREPQAVQGSHVHVDRRQKSVRMLDRHLAAHPEARRVPAVRDAEVVGPRRGQGHLRVVRADLEDGRVRKLVLIREKVLAKAGRVHDGVELLRRHKHDVHEVVLGDGTRLRRLHGLDVGDQRRVDLGNRPSLLALLVARVSVIHVVDRDAARANLLHVVEVEDLPGGQGHQPRDHHRCKGSLRHGGRHRSDAAPGSRRA
mmetsp:Transcript_66247/g.191942  ORF Transcript_66247/g.191942 Transcript_66247/m.191942 type:complete len:363 (-) Transcript_66247:60-1148(-)